MSYVYVGAQLIVLISVIHTRKRASMYGFKITVARADF